MIIDSIDSTSTSNNTNNTESNAIINVSNVATFPETIVTESTATLSSHQTCMRDKLKIAVDETQESAGATRIFPTENSVNASDKRYMESCFDNADDFISAVKQCLKDKGVRKNIDIEDIKLADVTDSYLSLNYRIPFITSFCDSLRDLCRELYSYNKTVISANSKLKESISPEVLIDFKLNKIYSGIIKGEKLETLEYIFESSDNYQDADLLTKHVKEELVTLCKEKDIFKVLECSYDFFFRLFMEKSVKFRDGYMCYFRENEINMKEKCEFFIDSDLQNISSQILYTDRYASDVKEKYRYNNKMISVTSHILACIHKNNSLDFDALGKLFAFMEMELFSLNLQGELSSCSESANDYFRFILNASNASNASELELNEIKCKISSIAGNNLMSEPFSFDQMYISFIGNQRRGTGYCHYICSVLITMLAHDNLISHDDCTEGKIKTLARFVDSLLFLKNLSFRKPLLAFNVREKLHAENDKTNCFDKNITYTRFANTYTTLGGVLKSIERATNSIALGFEPQSNTMSGHETVMIPLMINERKIYFYFDPNLGCMILHNNEMILRALSCSVSLIYGIKVDEVKSNKFYYSSLEVNDKLNRDFFIINPQYNAFIKAMKDGTIENWKSLDRLVSNDDWHNIFPELEKNNSEFSEKTTVNSGNVEKEKEKEIEREREVEREVEKQRIPKMDLQF